MRENITVRNFMRNYDRGEYDRDDVDTMIEAGWYDWFCKDKQLKKRLDALFPKVKEIVLSQKINPHTMYVFFKNNCPVIGSLYDDFRFCDMKTGEVIYTVVPASGHKANKGKAELWGRENHFKEALVEGTWADVRKYFGIEELVEAVA